MRGGQEVSKWDIFYYVYAVLHHPGYREKYAENLKRELPRIPLLGNMDTLRELAEMGEQLARLHLNYETAAEYPLRWIEDKSAFSWRVHKMKRKGNQIIVNDSLTLTDIPDVCFGYRLGNRAAVDWIIDQYQVSTDARTGLTSDPNRPDDPQYIVRLIGKIVTVSLETVRLVGEIGQVSLDT